MYAKLFASIYQGTLRGNTHGLVVFTNMLAHADKDGWVDMHPKAIAEEVGLSIDQVQAAINELESPDPDSRSPEENGRRIVRMDEHRAWGWVVVNHAKYRAIRSEEDRREQNRIAQEKWRNKNKPSVSRVSQASAESANTETETYTDTTKPKATAFRAELIELPMCIDRTVWAKWIEYRRGRKLPCSKVTIEAQVSNLAKWEAFGHSSEEIIMSSIANGWQGLFEPKLNGGNNGSKSRFDKLAQCADELTGRNRSDTRTFDGYSTQVD